MRKVAISDAAETTDGLWESGNRCLGGEPAMEALLTIAALSGAIWGVLLVLRMPLALGCVATLLVSVCFGYAFFFNLEIGSSHWTLDRLMLPLLVASFLVQRHFGRTTSAPLGSSEWLMLGLLGWLGMSLVTHDPFQPFGESATPLWRWTTGYGVPAMLYWIAWKTPECRRSPNGVQAALILFGVYLATTGLLEITQQWALVFPKHIADPKLGMHFGRARGPMLSSVTYGTFLGVSLVALLAAGPRLRRPLRWLLFALLVPLFLAGVYFSYTRSVWMGAGLGLMIVLALTTQGRTRVLILGGLLSLAVLVGLTKSEQFLSFKREASASAEDTRSSAESRLSFAYVSWKMFQDYPLHGVGFGQFPVAKLPYLSDRKVDLPLEAIRILIHHNTLLCLLVETGIVGLSLYVAMLVGWGRRAWRLYLAPDVPAWARTYAVLLLGVLGLYLCQLTSHEISYSTQDNCLIFFLAGMTAGVDRAGTDDERPIETEAPVQATAFPSETDAGRPILDSE